MTKLFKSKLCKECGVEFTPTAPCNQYCSSTCKTIVKKRQGRHDYEVMLKRTGRLHVLGVGKGGNTASGKDSPHYINGVGLYKKIRNTMAAECGYVCQECGCDLDRDNPYKWVCHHIDHNRKNNEPENLMVMCKSCHQIEHNAIDNLRTCNDYPERE